MIEIQNVRKSFGDREILKGYRYDGADWFSDRYFRSVGEAVKQRFYGRLTF